MSMAQRIEVCAARLKLSRAEAEAIQRALKGHAPDKQAGAFEVWVADKERAAAVVEKRTRVKDARLQDIARQQTPELATQAAMRVVDNRASVSVWKENKAWISAPSAAQTVEILKVEGTAMIQKHGKVFNNRRSSARLWQVKHGELKVDDLTPDELAAWKDMHSFLKSRKAATNTARGIPQHLDDGTLYPLIMRSLALASEKGGTKKEQAKSFADYMLTVLKDDDGWWSANDAERLRAFYYMRRRDEDGALRKEGGGILDDQPAGVADEAEEISPEAFWDLDRRGFEFKDAASEMAFWERYINAKNMNDFLADVNFVTARQEAAARIIGDVDAFRKGTIEILERKGVSQADIENFSKTLDNFTGAQDAIKEVRETAQLLSGVNSALNAGAMMASVLTLMQTTGRVFIMGARSAGIVRGVLNGAEAFVGSVTPERLVSEEVRRALDSSTLHNISANANVYKNVRLVGGATDGEMGKGAAAKAATALHQGSRWGVFKMTGYERFGQGWRGEAVLQNNRNLSESYFARANTWEKLTARQRDYLTGLGIGAKEYDVAARAFREGGMVTATRRRKLMDWSSIGDADIRLKWQVVANSVADEVAGFAPLNLDAWFKGGTEAGTLKRVGMNAATALTRDPATGSAQLWKHLHAISRFNKLEALGVGAGFMATGIAMAHLKSQIVHTWTYGEPHDYWQTRPKSYLAQLFAFSALEMWGEYLVDVAWADNHGAALGGSPAFATYVKAAHGISNALIYREDSDLADWFRDYNSERARSYRDLARTLPVPFYIGRPAAAYFDPERQSSLIWLGVRD